MQRIAAGRCKHVTAMLQQQRLSLDAACLMLLRCSQTHHIVAEDGEEFYGVLLTSLVIWQNIVHKISSRTESAVSVYHSSYRYVREN